MDRLPFAFCAAPIRCRQVFYRRLIDKGSMRLSLSRLDLAARAWQTMRDEGFEPELWPEAARELTALLKASAETDSRMAMPSGTTRMLSGVPKPPIGGLDYNGDGIFGDASTEITDSRL